MKIYVDMYSYNFDSVYGRGYPTRKLAKEDECLVNDIMFDESYCLEQYESINQWQKLCIATQLIVRNCKTLGIAKEDIVLVNINFDGKDLSKDLLRMVKQNYDVEFGEYKVNTY